MRAFLVLILALLLTAQVQAKSAGWTPNPHAAQLFKCHRALLKFHYYPEEGWAAEGNIPARSKLLFPKPIEISFAKPTKPIDAVVVPGKEIRTGELDGFFVYVGSGGGKFYPMPKGNPPVLGPNDTKYYSTASPVGPVYFAEGPNGSGRPSVLSASDSAVNFDILPPKWRGGTPRPGTAKWTKFKGAMEAVFRPLKGGKDLDPKDADFQKSIYRDFESLIPDMCRQYSKYPPGEGAPQFRDVLVSCPAALNPAWRSKLIANQRECFKENVEHATKPGIADDAAIATKAGESKMPDIEPKGARPSGRRAR